MGNQSSSLQQKKIIENPQPPKRTSSEKFEKKGGSGEKAEKKSSAEKAGDENQYEALPDLDTIQNAEVYKEVSARGIVNPPATGILGKLLSWTPWGGAQETHKSFQDTAPRSPLSSAQGTPGNSPAVASLRGDSAPPQPGLNIRPPEDKRAMVKWNNPQYDTLKMDPTDKNLFLPKTPQPPKDEKAMAPVGSDNYKTLAGIVDPFTKK